MKYLVVLCASLLFVSSLLSPQFKAQGLDQSARVERVEGTVEVLYQDYEDGRSRTAYFLNTGAEKLELRFKDSGPALRAGDRIRVGGKKKAGTVSVDSSIVLQASLTGHAVGEQRQLVMLFNFQDQPANKPWTNAYIQDLLFNQVNQYYQQISYGQTWITGDIVGWYTIPVNSTDCTADITQPAESGALALGYDPSLYSHLVFVFPTKTCGASVDTTISSIGSLGNYETSIYIDGGVSFYLLAHEFGHSLGFNHSNSLNCRSVTLSSTCTFVNYGDNYDVMGYYNDGVLNAYHRDLGGWFNSNQVIQTVTAGGTYTIDPIENANPGVKALRIQQAYDPTTNTYTYYYIEYKQATGYDSFLSSYPAITSGVMVHLGSIGNDPNKWVLGSELLDMSPGTSGANEALAVGKSYMDPAIPLTITLLSAGSAGATVSIQFSAPSCSASNPTVAMTPSASQVSASGTAVTHTVTVTDNDGTSCAASSFSLQAAIPSGWTASFAAPMLNLSPGGSASTTMQVTSSSSAVNGSYSIGAIATNSLTPAYSGSASATDLVASSLGVVESSNKSSYTRNQSVTMTASVTALGLPVAGAAVNFSVTKPNGAVMTQTGTTGSNGLAQAGFRLKKTDPVGTYQSLAVAKENSLSGSGATSFRVQ